MRKTGLGWRSLVTTALVLYGIGTASARTAEEKCQEQLYRAAGAYAKCQNRAQALWSSGQSLSAPKMRLCIKRYTDKWSRLQALFLGTGSTCDQARFTDLGSVVVDHLTSLTWEKKTDDGGVQDLNNLYSWSATGTAADGTLFTGLMAALNGAGLGGFYDWRAPSSAELQTIQNEAYLCLTQPCVVPDLDTSLTAAGNYWGSNTLSSDATQAWYADFQLGTIFVAGKTLASGAYGRGVRGGLF